MSNSNYLSVTDMCTVVIAFSIDTQMQVYISIVFNYTSTYAHIMYIAINKRNRLLTGALRKTTRDSEIQKN